MGFTYRIAETPSSKPERLHCASLHRAMELADACNYDTVVVSERFGLLQLFVKVGNTWTKVDGKCGMSWSDFMSKFGCEVN